MKGKRAKAPAEDPKDHAANDVSVEVATGTTNQDGLPGVTISDRKIAEIEDLAEVVAEREKDAKLAREKLADAKENLIASMKRHERNHYNRKTWGSVTMKHSDSITVKQEGQGDDE